MRRAIGEGWLLRVVGSGISPNALGFSDKCLISMAQMDKVLNVDVNTKQVCVTALAAAASRQKVMVLQWRLSCIVRKQQQFTCFRPVGTALCC